MHIRTTPGEHPACWRPQALVWGRQGAERCQVEAEGKTGDRMGVPVGTLAGTVRRAIAGAAIGVVSSGLPRVTHPPGVTGRRSGGHWWISRSLSTLSETTCPTR